MNHSKSSEFILLAIWGISVTAVLGSLFYSEILGYVPCDLCWIQRIFMYPLVIIYGTAAMKRELNIALPGLILAGIGIFISTYHYLIQKLPALQDAGGTCTIVPCNVQYVNYFNFITIPFLAGTAFLMIVILHIILLVREKEGRAYER